MKNKIAAMTIAGSDSGGGAGIQADLKTFSALGIYGTTIITAITAQNFNKITDMKVLSPETVENQIKAVLHSYPIKAIKTGLLYSEDIIDCIVNTISKPLKEKDIKLIVDPVMVSTSGMQLLTPLAIEKIQNSLFPIASLITPNIPEAEFIIDKKIKTVDDMKDALKTMFDLFHVPILLKGGHLANKATDILLINNDFNIFENEIIEGINTHGSGCTLSAAIASYLSIGYSLLESVKFAKDYLTASLNNPLEINENIKIINQFF